MQPSIIRRSGKNIVILERLYGTGGSPDFWTARAYELAGHDSKHTGRVYMKDGVYGDIGQATNAKQEKETYRIIEFLFPELINKGLKSEGYIKYKDSDVLSEQVK